NYGQSTPSSSAGSGSGETTESPVTISALQAGETYHYRLVATNVYGTTVGPDRAFTAASPPSISGVRSLDLTETGADLSGRNNPVGFETTYHFDYGPTTSLGSSVPATGEVVGADDSPHTVTAHLSDLRSGVTYYFKLIASNKWGTSVSDVTTFNFFPP